VTLSVIVCTYQRHGSVITLLKCLEAQEYKDFEVLIIDGGDEASYQKLVSIAKEFTLPMDVKVMRSHKGLTRQRNLGLRFASGDLLCLLDDDVEFDPTFLGDVVALFNTPSMEKVGGISGYDVTNYPERVNLRWRLRRFLKTVPSLEPGAINRLGRSVPVGFFRPFSGCKRVGFFYGFCMIYRRAAVEGILFDEVLPTYGGEDRDFSFRVSQNWILLICGDLHVRHRRSEQSRDSLAKRMYQAGFGAGRTFAKYCTRSLDYADLAWWMFSEFLIDIFAFFQNPSTQSLRLPFARVNGVVDGIRSFSAKQPATVMDPDILS
jgi:glycosyltransferase involved in cell wall biosynthesis